MVLVTTRSTEKDRLRDAGSHVNATACATRLARISRRNLDEQTTRPSKLVAEHLGEARPSRIPNTSGTMTSHHSSNVQLLQHDDAVALGESCRLDVQEVIALPTHLSVDACDADLGLLSVLRTFLPPTDGTLGAGKSFERGFEVTRIGDHIAVGRSAEVDDATVDRDDGCVARRWFGDIDLADDTDEPLITVAPEHAGLRLSFERTVHLRVECSEFGETNVSTVEPPNLRMRLAKGERTTSFALETWRSRELLEAALPRLVEFDEELSTYVTWDVSEPCERSTQLGQLFHLIESRWINALTFRSCQTEFSLFKREIPEKSESVIPCVESNDLLGYRIDAIAKSLAHLHQGIIPQTPHQVEET